MQAQTEKQTRWMATVTSTCINGELKGSCTASYIPFVWSWNKGSKVSSENRNPKPERTAQEVKPADLQRSPRTFQWGEDALAGVFTASGHKDGRPLPYTTVRKWAAQRMTERVQTGHTHTHTVYGEWRVMLRWKERFFFHPHTFLMCWVTSKNQTIRLRRKKIK